MVSTNRPRLSSASNSGSVTNRCSTHRAGSPGRGGRVVHDGFTSTTPARARARTTVDLPAPEGPMTTSSGSRRVSGVIAHRLLDGRAAERERAGVAQVGDQQVDVR